MAFKSTAKYTHNKHVYVHLYEFNFNGTKYIFELFGPLLLLVLGGNQSNAILKPLQCDQPYRINGDVDVCYFVLFCFFLFHYCYFHFDYHRVAAIGNNNVVIIE